MGDSQMTYPPNSPIEKALALNLDPLKYGTIAEIGAGQEVARWFFQAGATAGTVAKTMSAYDMNFSDEIYGPSKDKRYVSKQRLEKMLEKEFDLVLSRIEAHRPEGSTFFAFANTVKAQGYNKRGECHGWMGIRFQRAPKLAPDEIILHARLLDDTNIEQQEALGQLGVNLIYGAFFLRDAPERMLHSLMDNLKWGRVEIDLVEMRGPTLGSLDDRLMALEIVKGSLARAVLFDPDGKVVIPADALYKKSVLAMRGRFDPITPSEINRFKDAKNRFTGTLSALGPTPSNNVIQLAEMTMADLANNETIDTRDFLARVTALAAAGYYVLISEFFRYFRVRQYLSRYTREPVGMVAGTAGFAEIFREDYYDGLAGGMLEGLGQLFPDKTLAYFYPVLEDGQIKTLEDVPIAAHLKPLFTYLKDRGRIISVDDYAGDDV